MSGAAEARLEAARQLFLAGDQAALAAALGLPHGSRLGQAALPVEPVEIVLPNVGEPCSSCGATVEECNKVIAQTTADRSCCLTCKRTDTHQLSGRG